MEARVNVLVGEVLILHCHENGDCHAAALRASSELSQSADCHSVRSRVWSELLQSAGDCQSERSRVFRPNSVGTLANLPMNPRFFRRTTWTNGDKTTALPSANHSHAVWNWDVSLRFNKSSRERKFWIRSHKYLAIHRQEKQVPNFNSQRFTTETRWIIVRTQILQRLSQQAILPRKRASEMDCSGVRLCHKVNRLQSDR